MSEIEKITIITSKTTVSTLNKYIGAPFENMIKFTVDLKNKLLAFGGEMHADSEKELLEHGSKQEDIWGSNFYPLKSKEERLEFTSLINIRPGANNFGMEIGSEEIRNSITKIVNELITFD